VLVDAHVHLLPEPLAELAPLERMAHVRALGLDGDAESAVLGGTAERLLAA